MNPSTPQALNFPQLLNRNPDVNVQESEYKRLLGYPPGHQLSGRARELADWAREWYQEQGKPWICTCETDDFRIIDGAVRINGTEFTSAKLVSQLVAAEAHGVMLAAVSAGKECEEKARQLWDEEKPDEYFFLEVYGSAVVEHLILTAGFQLCAWADQHAVAVLPHYGPGYPGWDVSDQNKLLSLIQQANGNEFPGEIHALQTGMLQPKKSLLAVFGITAQTNTVQPLAELIPCYNCSLPSCQYRRAPHKTPLPQIERVHRLQKGKTNVSRTAAALKPHAKYSISDKALHKWTQERLKLSLGEDGSVEAIFRYEGTTCSDMGRPLEFDYSIRLRAVEEGYTFVSANCVPAPDDMGYSSMCEYLTNAEHLMGRIAEEKPLLGKSLDDVLEWKRPFSPNGCYCTHESRQYKWGLVFEVLHYALAHYEHSPIDVNVETWKEP